MVAKLGEDASSQSLVLQRSGQWNSSMGKQILKATLTVWCQSEISAMICNSWWNMGTLLYPGVKTMESFWLTPTKEGEVCHFCKEDDGRLSCKGSNTITRAYQANLLKKLWQNLKGKMPKKVDQRFHHNNIHHNILP